jgi:DNA-binding CsgD family transcriptional regulator
MPRSSRLPLVRAVIEQVGMDRLADVETGAVRHRPVPPRLVARLLRGMSDDGLTKKEREVMVLVTSGYGERETAEVLGCSKHTVHDHLKRIYLKLSVHTRVDAINAFLDWEA